MPRPLFPNFNLARTAKELEAAGFQVMESLERFPTLRFFDVGAIVFFARIIEWEFPGFTVDGCLDALLGPRRELEAKGQVESVEHRFLPRGAKAGKRTCIPGKSVVIY